MPAQAISLTPEMKKKFQRLDNYMSPENLYWDGERSPAEAEAALRRLKADWKALETRVGRKVTTTEIYR